MRSALAAAVLLVVITGCRHTVEVKAPQEPITINLNIKIEHEIRIKVDKELEDLFQEESDIF